MSVTYPAGGQPASPVLPAGAVPAPLSARGAGGGRWDRVAPGDRADGLAVIHDPEPDGAGQTSTRVTPATPVGTGIEMSLLGGFALVCGGTMLTLPVHAQRLLAFLGLSEQSSRVLTAGTLWSEASEQRALGNLRSTVWRLQRMCPQALTVSRNMLALSAAVTVDVTSFRSSVAMLGKRPSDLAVAEFAQGTYCRDLLPGWYEDWVLAERDSLQHLRLHALEEVAELLLRRGRFSEALDAALAAVRTDPLRESALRLVLRIHVAEGNRVEALRHFRAYRALLAAELGMEPSPRTWALLTAPN